MSTQHAKLSASGSHRWLACPGSIKAEEGIKDKQSPHAAEGSMAHELAELVLEQGGSAFDWEGKHLIEWNAEPVTREMVEYIQEYVDFVASVGGTQMYEEQVDFSPWVPEGFGTSDVIAFDGDTMRIIDLKYGKGIKVYAKDNPQGVLYALGALNEYGDFYDFERIIITIHQPRLDHIDEWEINKDDLLKWGEWIAQRAELALSDDAERVPGEKQCSFCKVRHNCKALETMTAKVIGAEFDDLDELDTPDTLSDRRLAEILTDKKLVVGWLDAVEAHLKAKAEAGEHVEGFKLVAGRSLRKWGDEELAEQTLVGLVGDDAYERKLLSVAKAEKKLGKKRAGEIAELIIKPAGKPALVPESDPRKPITITVDDFDEIGCKA